MFVKKGIIYIVATLLICGNLLVFAFASDINELREVEMLLDDEKSFLITESSDGSEGKYLIDEPDLGNARKIYFSETLMLTAYEESKTVESIISEKYQWCVPEKDNVDSVSVFTVNENGAELSGIRPALGYYMTDVEISNLLTDYGVETADIISIKYVFSSLYYTVFNIVETSEDILCIPYSSNDEFLGVESKKVYVFEDLMDSMIKRFDESKLTENPDSNGGVPLRENNTSWVYAIIILSAVSVVVLTILIVRTKKNKSNA